MDAKSILLGLILIALGTNAYFTYTLSEQVKDLHNENVVLWHKLDSVQTAQAVKATKPAGNSNKSIGSVIASELERSIRESERAEAARKAAQKVTVTTKYRLEDRYVSGGVDIPDVLGKESGEVTLNISVDHIVKVKSAQLASYSGITDEEVLEACKKAALKTSFNYNSDAPERQEGTITYIFKKK